MSYLQEQLKLLKFDRRMLDSNLKNGNVTQAEYDQYLTNLGDMQDKVVAIELTEDGSDSTATEPQQQVEATSVVDTMGSTEATSDAVTTNTDPSNPYSFNQ